MHTIETNILIASTPARVLEALTTKEGIKGWWTTDCECDSEKREAIFRFEKQSGGISSHTFRLDAADESGVTMSCVQSTAGDWLGTKLVFKLAADGTNTRVALAHSGYPAKNEMFEMCTKGWTFFTNSLKSYLEVGKGEPHVRPSKAA